MTDGIARKQLFRVAVAKYVQTVNGALSLEARDEVKIIAVLGEADPVEPGSAAGVIGKFDALEAVFVRIEDAFRLRAVRRDTVEIDLGIAVFDIAFRIHHAHIDEFAVRRKHWPRGIGIGNEVEAVRDLFGLLFRRVRVDQEKIEAERFIGLSRLGADADDASGIGRPVVLQIVVRAAGQRGNVPIKIGYKEVHMLARADEAPAVELIAEILDDDRLVRSGLLFSGGPALYRSEQDPFAVRGPDRVDDRAFEIGHSFRGTAFKIMNEQLASAGFGSGKIHKAFAVRRELRASARFCFDQLFFARIHVPHDHAAGLVGSVSDQAAVMIPAVQPLQGDAVFYCRKSFSHFRYPPP